jgi:hypothetical protein
MMPGLALTVANPLIVVIVPADWGRLERRGGSTIMGGSRTSGTDSDLDVSIHRGASPGRPEFGRPGPLNLSNSPMNPANHSMKEKVQ